MNYQVHITKTAEHDIAKAADYIEFVLKNPQAADHLLDVATEKIGELTQMPEKLQLVDDPVLAVWGIRFIRVNNYLAFYTIDEDKKVVIIVRFLYQKSNWNTILRQGFCRFFFAVRRTADRVIGRSVANMRKRMLSGIRDLWIVLFCLMERTLLQILLAVPVPVRMVLVGVLVAKYVGCLFCTSLSMTILTVVMTAFVATNIKKWNAEFQIIYVTARLRKRSRKKVYNFI